MAQRVEIEGVADFAQALKEIDRLNKRLEKTEKKVDKLSKKKLKIDTDPAQKELDDLRKEVKRLERNFDSAAKSVKAAEIALESAKRGIGSTTKATAALARANKRLVDRSKELIDFSKRLPPELRKVATGLDKVEKQAEQAERAFRRLTRVKKPVFDLVSSIRQLRASVGLLIAGLVIQKFIRFGQALIQIGADAVETKQKFDALIPGLTAFTSSVELAEGVAGQLANTSERLKTPLADLIQPFLRITAATKETNLSLSEQSQLFESALLTARAFGLGTEQVSRLITGFAQVAGKGTLQMEELRQQIGEVAFNALPALAKALGTTVPLLIEDVAAGAIDAETALRGLAEGLTAANEAAGLAQLDTLKGDLGDLQRVTENAERSFVDGLEPGLRLVTVALTDFLAGNQEVIRELGRLASEGFTALVDVFGNVREGLVQLGENLQVVAERFKVLGAIPGFEKIGEALDGLGVSLSGVRAEAIKTFDEFEKQGLKFVTKSQETAIEVQEAFIKSFREQAKAAGASAEEIKAIEQELKVSIGKIFDESIEERRDLEKKFIADFEQFGKVRVETQREAAKQINAINKKSIADITEIVSTFVETSKASAEARVKAEAAAAEEIKVLIGGIVESAKETAAERIETSQATTDKIVELERAAAEKIEELAAEASEALLKSGADREKIAAELSSKVVAIEEKLASDTVREQERVAAAAKAVADKRIAEEERVRKDQDKSIAKLKELSEAIAELAKGEEEGSALGGLAKDSKEIAENLEDAAESLTLFGGTEISGDPLGFLETGFKDVESLLGGASDGLGTFADKLTDVSAASEGAANFTQQLRDAIAKVKEELGTVGAESKKSLDIVLSGFESLVEQGFVSQQAFENFGTEIGEAIKPLGPAAEEAAAGVGIIADQAQGLGEVGKAAESSAGGVVKLGDEAGKTGQQIVKLADGTTLFVNAGGELDSALAKSAEEVQKLGTAAEGTAVPLEQIGEAAEQLREPIIGEDEAAKIEALGTASTEAAPGVAELATPIDTVSISAERLATALPTVAEALAKIQPAIDAIFKILGESDFDLAETATQIERLSEPLTAIGTALTTIQGVTATLPGEVEAVQKAIKPLFESVKAASEDDRFGLLGVALKAIAEALVEIPTPLKEFQELIAKIADQKDDIQTTLKAIKEGLEEIGSEELRTGIGELGEALEELLESLNQTSTAAEKLKDLVKEIGTAVPALNKALEALGTTVADKVVPALDSGAVSADKLGTQFEETAATAEELGKAAEAAGEAGEAAMLRIAEAAATANARLQEVLQTLKGINEEAAKVDLP